MFTDTLCMVEAQHPYLEFAADGVQFINAHLKSYGYWTGPVVDVTNVPSIAPPSKRNQNDYEIAQATYTCVLRSYVFCVLEGRCTRHALHASAHVF